MKRRLTIALLATALAASAPAAITAGLEAGYLTDNQDPYCTGRVGWEFRTGGSFSHQVELELGTTKHEETVSLLGAPVTATTKLKPVMINYRAEATMAGNLGYYFGAGVGQAKASYSQPGSGVLVIRDSDSAFALQVFTGLSYHASANATLHLGVKYLRINDAMLFNSSVEVGDDLALTAGASIRF